MSAPLSRGSEEYLSWLAVEKGRSPHTLAGYRRDLARYEAALGAAGSDPAQSTAAQVAGYLAGLRGAGASPASVARALSAIRGLQRFLVREQMAGGDPTEDMGPVGVPARLPKALGEAQVGALLDSLDGPDPVSRRDRALLELLYATGARVSEAVGLDITDLPASSPPVLVGAPVGAPGTRSAVAGAPGAPAAGPGVEEHPGGGGRPLLRLEGKGGRERLVPVGRAAEAALAVWLAPGGRDRLVRPRETHRADSAAVFVNGHGRRLSRQAAYHIVQSRARAAGLGATVSPHVLRHSCATHMLAHGADVRVVQELLGHASIATTQLYTKVSPEHLRAAYENAHPRAGGRPG